MAELMPERLHRLVRAQRAGCVGPSLINIAWTLPGFRAAQAHPPMTCSGKCRTAFARRSRGAPGLICSQLVLVIDNFFGFEPILFGLAVREPVCIPEQERLLTAPAFPFLISPWHRSNMVGGPNTPRAHGTFHLPNCSPHKEAHELDGVANDLSDSAPMSKLALGAVVYRGRGSRDRGPLRRPPTDERRG